jgi:hypothetical protein
MWSGSADDELETSLIEIYFLMAYFYTSEDIRVENAIEKLHTRLDDIGLRRLNDAKLITKGGNIFNQNSVVVNEKVAKTLNKQMKWTSAAGALGITVALLVGCQIVVGIDSIRRWIGGQLTGAIKEERSRKRIHAREWNVIDVCHSEQTRQHILARMRHYLSHYLPAISPPNAVSQHSTRKFGDC